MTTLQANCCFMVNKGSAFTRIFGSIDLIMKSKGVRSLGV